MLTREQKILEPEYSHSLGRVFLYMLPETEVFTLELIHQIHELYCSEDPVYGTTICLKQHLFINNIKWALSRWNKSCSGSCLTRAEDGNKRYYMHHPGGLGGSFQFTSMLDPSKRASTGVVDLLGPFKGKCYTGECEQKYWVLLIINPVSGFLSLEILEDQSSNAIIGALVHHMGRHGLFMQKVTM